MKRIASKVLSCIIALTMVVSMVPSQAFATDVEDEVASDSVLAGSFDVEFEAEDESGLAEDADSLDSDGLVRSLENTFGAY